jgi:hypothetical protein
VLNARGMIKGMEAMCVQSMLAAKPFGVDDRVLASLAERAAPLVEALDEKSRLPRWRTLLRPA